MWPSPERLSGSATSDALPRSSGDGGAAPGDRQLGGHRIPPLLHLTYTASLPLLLIWRTHDPRFLAANGQVLMCARTPTRRGRLRGRPRRRRRRHGLLPEPKRARQRVVFADGFALVRCRMYEGARGVWSFSKNLYEGIGGHPAALALVSGLYLSAFLMPLVWLAFGARGATELLAPGAVGTGAVVATRLALALRMRHNWRGLLAHPLAIVGFIAIGINSMRWVLLRRVKWAAASTARGASVRPALPPEVPCRLRSLSSAPVWAASPPRSRSPRAARVSRA